MTFTTRLTTPLVALVVALAGAGCKTVVLPSSDDDSGGDTSGGSAGTGGSTGEPGVNCGELAANTITVLEANCAKCHGADSAALGSINYITNLDALIKNGKVVPGDPNNSPIWRRLTSTDAPMPPPSEMTRPSDDDVSTIERWIGQCAGATGCGDQPWMGREEVINLIRNDLLNTQEISADARPFIRYFSLVHLYNYGWCDDQIEIYRHGLYKLVNSLSQDTKIVQPKPIDKDRLLFRVDLRDYNWDRPVTEIGGNGAVGDSFKDVWELIADNDPYAIEFEGDSAADVKSATQTKVFLLQADAFLNFASQPPLYHDVLGIPFTRKELEKQFGIDPLENNIIEEIKTDPDRVARAAFHDSGVSENHRVIERHDFPDNSNRVYWISYDFASNAGDANVFVRPFGNKGVADGLDPKGQPEVFDGFTEAGSEIIFSLPNGMQGYMVVKGDGTRLDEAPIAIVQDKNAEDGIVRNGISCMGCHSSGMIGKEDDLRWEIDQGEGEADFTQDELDAIRALYPAREEMNSLLKLDGDRFNLAVQNAGVPIGGDKEPIVTVFLAFDEDVEIRRAAAELWTTESTLREKLGELSPDLDDLGKEATGVRRDVFSEAYADAICRLKVGITKACPK
jgi:serine/threonine-protein kinase